MVDEVTTIINELKREGQELEKAPYVDAYLDIIKDTVSNQHQILNSYEELTKKLEKQIVDCQTALDEGTKRELEQLTLIMELKTRKLMRKQKAELGEKVCRGCDAYEEENALLREQASQQSEIIDKLSETQELLMLQYKVLELGLNKELVNIAKTQQELEILKNEPAVGADEKVDEKADENNDDTEKAE